MRKMTMTRAERHEYQRLSRSFMFLTLEELERLEELHQKDQDR